MQNVFPASIGLSLKLIIWLVEVVRKTAVAWFGWYIYGLNGQSLSLSLSKKDNSVLWEHSRQTNNANGWEHFKTLAPFRGTIKDVI